MNSFYKCRVSVKGMLFRNSKFLILKRKSSVNEKDGLWELPGGMVDYDESPNDAIVREIFEETSIEVLDVSPIYVFNINRSDGKIVGIVYTLKFAFDEVVLSDEHEDYMWISEADVDDYNFVGDLKSELLDYFRKERE